MLSNDKNGTPKDVVDNRYIKCIKIPAAIPNKPVKYPKIIYINLKILIEKEKEKSGIANSEIAVIATIITKIGLTIFAVTAASPKIKVPTIPNCLTERHLALLLQLHE